MLVLFSSISIIAGLITFPVLCRIGLYSVITVLVSLMIIVLYITYNSVKRPPFMAYPWLPQKWITSLSILVLIASDILLTTISLVIISSL
ncbi:MAG: hypothetical protein GSR82_05765 [Desulfurococcales archaeon]|nr:hypothetical protein [Desulfurococcales archaeon]